MTRRAQRSEEPQLIDEVANALGRDAFVRLCFKLGGARVFVPQKIPANHPLRLVLGDDADVLSQKFSGETIHLPLLLKKHKGIEADLRAGMSVAEVAAKYWCSTRNVYFVKARLKAEANEPPEQGNLF
jgi:hypothetical protein